MSEHFSNANANATADVFEWLARLRRERQPAVLATLISVTGSAPQVPGAKMLILSADRIIGTIGGGALEHRVIQMGVDLLGDAARSSTERATINLTRDLGMCCGGEMEVFLERVLGRDRLVLFGAGHIGKEVSSLASRAGFEVTIVDQREELATPARFPDAREILCEEPEVVLPELLLDEATYCIVVTHDHPLDQALVKELCQRPLRFLGLVGSRTKRSKFLMRLRAQGVDEKDLGRIRSPVGLHIGGITPEEIAVSIVAELIAVRRGVLEPASGGADTPAAERMIPSQPAPEEEQ